MSATIAPVVKPQMNPSYRKFVMLSRKQEEESLQTLAPFRAEPELACKCGSCERVYNNRGRIFCRRCGKPQPDRSTVKRAYGITQISDDHYGRR